MHTKSNEGENTARLLWDSDVTGTSFRRGAAMQEVVAKTGHDMRGARVLTVWEYMDGDNPLLSYGSAGWVNPYKLSGRSTLISP